MPNLNPWLQAPCLWLRICVFREMLVWRFEIPVEAKLTQNLFLVLSFCMPNEIRWSFHGFKVTFETWHVAKAAEMIKKKKKNMLFNIVATLNDLSKNKKKKLLWGLLHLAVKGCSVNRAENHKSTQNNKSPPWRLPVLLQLLERTPEDRLWIEHPSLILVFFSIT